MAGLLVSCGSFGLLPQAFRLGRSRTRLGAAVVSVDLLLAVGVFVEDGRWWTPNSFFAREWLLQSRCRQQATDVSVRQDSEEEASGAP